MENTIFDDNNDRNYLNDFWNILGVYMKESNKEKTIRKEFGRGELRKCIMPDCNNTFWTYMGNKNRLYSFCKEHRFRDDWKLYANM
jgi:hypothetical protein